MLFRKNKTGCISTKNSFRVHFVALILTIVSPFNIFSNTFALDTPDSTATSSPAGHRNRKPVITHINPDPTTADITDSIRAYDPSLDAVIIPEDSIIVAVTDSIIDLELERPDARRGMIIGVDPNYDPDYIVREFNPDPTRAAWLSALFPGLGQLYNRRYWKLPIVAGGFMGLLYGYSWNNQMFEEYTQGYRDLMDSDPQTNSYLDFYPPGTDESSLNTTYLQSLFKSRKDYYRRNRDFCIIGMIGVYLVAIVDAYVDASLTHFDISPELSLDMAPTFIPDGRAKLPGFGFAWAITF